MADPAVTPSAPVQPSSQARQESGAEPLVDAAVPPVPPAPPAPAGRLPFGRRVGRRTLLALVGLVVIAAIVVVELPQYLFPASSSGETIWQKITDGIASDGSVSSQTALEAFAYDFKVDVPGVTLPTGVDGQDAPTSGTSVLNWVETNWDQLRHDQQAVIDRYITPASGDVVLPSAGPSSAEVSSVRLTAARISGPTDPPAVNGSVSLQDAMFADVLADVARIGPELGMTTIPEDTSLVLAYPFTFSTIQLDLSPLDGGIALMVTHPVAYKELYAPCHITAFHNAWAGEQVTANGGVSPRLHVLLTHEVVHCYQNVAAGDIATSFKVPSWIGEGTAMYLAALDTGIAEPLMNDMWTKEYVGKPDKALTARTYDAYGYYALLAHEGRNMWDLMAPAWTAAFHAQDVGGTFIAALSGDASDVLNNWAESFLRSSDWGDPWQMYGFGLPAGAVAPQAQAVATLQPGTTGQLPGMANRVVDVTKSEGEVVFIVTDGVASVHDQYGNSDIAFQSARFCVTGDCVCPKGTLLAGQDMASQDQVSQDLTVPFVAAFNAGQAGSTYVIASAKLDDLCKHGATPQPQPQASPAHGPCTNCSNSNGDPHMLTVNGYRYEFQAAGEFTLLRSSDGSLEIQARQEPYQNSTVVSINTAIAARVGDHKVGVYVTGSGLVAHVDGQVVDLSSGPVDLGGGARIAAVNKGYEVDFPDGTQLWTLAVGVYGINAQIKPGADIATTGQGLLGEVVPGGLGVPSLPDGTRLPAASDSNQRFQTVYGQFADAWRVTDSTTLFEYDSGKSTASYTIKPFPTESKVLTDLTADQQAAGDSACAAIGDPTLHEECAFDVGLTGQSGFADSYQAVQTFYDSGIAEATPTPATPSYTPPPGLVSGAWQVTAGTNVPGFAVGENDTIYADVQTGDNAFSLMALDPVNQKILAQVPVPLGTEVHYAAGSVWLPGLETDAQGNRCSVSRFDGQSLAEQATIPIPCGYFGTPEVASDGSTLWFVDVSKYDLGTQKGAVMTALDPATDAPSGNSVPLPFINGYRLDSQGAVFYYGTDPSQGFYRLVAGGSAFDQLGSLGSTIGHPAGPGLWVASQDGSTASYYTSSGAPQATLQIGGSLVAGDTTAAYVEVFGNDAQGNTQEQLWRYPIDGSTPTQIGAAPTIDGQMEAYAEDPLPQSNGDGVFKFWITRNGSSQANYVLLQWTPTK